MVEAGERDFLALFLYSPDFLVVGLLQHLPVGVNNLFPSLVQSTWPDCWVKVHWCSLLPLFHPRQQWHPSTAAIIVNVHACGCCMFYMEIISCYRVSYTSVAGSHSVGLVYSTIGLIPISNLSKNGLEL